MTMDLCLPAGFFDSSNHAHVFRDDLGPARDVDPSASRPRRAFVTGLRDWRRVTATHARHPAHVADGEWRPL
jgi:hypothetical protein